MYEIIAQMTPVIMTFIVGVLLKRLKIFSNAHADMLLILVFYVSLPALILTSVAEIKLSLDLALLPFVAGFIMITSFFAARLSSRFFDLTDPVKGVFLTGSMIINMSFIYPFALAAYGQEGLVRATLFDFGACIMVFTVGHNYARKYGSNKGSAAGAAVLLKSPVIWAVIAAFILNIFQIIINPVAKVFLLNLGDMTIPLSMIALGIYFSPRITKGFIAFWVIGQRMLLGLVIGVIFAELFRLEGLNRLVVIISAAAPAGYTTLTFASMENLDKGLAATVVSYSIIFGVMLTPLLIFFLA